ncbi:MAG: hypothetical protein F6K10_37080 [Moorea sp. SIO2B7]|nr:hypothetical protein [Moorena sp. SIO2B7]
MFQFLYYLIQTIQIILVPLCFVLAWTFLGLLWWSLFRTIRDAAAKAKQMHKIPCTKCQFFTGDYRLKCTVQPYIANTEGAINCCDYRSREHIL